MNIFGIGGTELILIMLIMLVVAGPQRMIRWAYWLGVYTGKLRKMWSQTMAIVQQEIDAAGVDIQLPKDLPTRQNIQQVAQQVMKPLTNQFEQAAKSVQEEIKPIQEQMKPIQEQMKPIQEDAQKARQTLQIDSRKLTPLGTVGSATRPGIPRPASPPTPPVPAPASPAAPPAASFGTWGQAQPPTPPDAPAAKSDTFGTWGNSDS